MRKIPASKTIRSIVRMAVESYAEAFKAKHISEVDDPQGTINMKINNVFISALGPEIRYYSALIRSLDSSLGNTLEKLAINIAKLFFTVKRNVEGPLSIEQTQKIAELLEKYKRNEKTPEVKDYQFLRKKPKTGYLTSKRHDSDYYLIDRSSQNHYLIELKIGGNLDSKKARSEKEAILEQFAILSNTLPKSKKIFIFFATAYNFYGEGKPWLQQRVRQFFADKELLIGKDFWNFICQSPQGYNLILDEYRKNAHLIIDALKSIKKTYLH